MLPVTQRRRGSLQTLRMAVAWSHGIWRARRVWAVAAGWTMSVVADEMIENRAKYKFEWDGRNTGFMRPRACKSLKLVTACVIDNTIPEGAPSFGGVQ